MIRSSRHLNGGGVQDPPPFTGQTYTVPPWWPTGRNSQGKGSCSQPPRFESLTSSEQKSISSHNDSGKNPISTPWRLVKPKEHPFLLSLHNTNSTQIHLEGQQFPGKTQHLVNCWGAQIPHRFRDILHKSKLQLPMSLCRLHSVLPRCLMGHRMENWPADLHHSLPSRSWNERNPHLSNQSSLIWMAIQDQMFSKH